MGPFNYFNFTFAINKEIKGFWFEKYATSGGYQVSQFGVLGIVFSLKYGYKKSKQIV